MTVHDVVSADSSAGTTPSFSAYAPYKVAAATLAATAVVQLGDPTTHNVPSCPLYFFTGINCPFCGGLRSVYELGHFNFTAALQDNVVVVLGIPIAVTLWVLWALRRGRPGKPWPVWLKLSLLVLLVAFMAVRNIPDVTFLRPPPVG